MESRGAKVHFLADRPFKSIFFRALTTHAPCLVVFFIDKIYVKFLAQCSIDFDIIFVVNGQTLSNKTLKKIKERFPSALLYLYMWDSFSNRPNAIKNLKYFDYISTFDPKDSIKYSIKFRPLFFSQIDAESANEKPQDEYDWSFIGTNHSDRFITLKKIISKNPQFKKYFLYLYMQSNWVFWVMKIINKDFRHSKKSNFKFSPLNSSQIHSVFTRSQSILDIEHSEQFGLTMRTFECLGACKKLITTNSSIKKYDFYNPSNICVINRINPVIPTDFLKYPYQELSKELYYKYSIAGWLDEILDTNNYQG